MPKLLLWLALSGTLAALDAAPKSLFYLSGDAAGRESFLAHADKVDILVPTWYRTDAGGIVSGGPDETVVAAARAHHVQLMPIVVNPGFDEQNFHQLLLSDAAHARLIASLVAECRKNGYLGIQFDFEHIFDADRDALSGLVREAAAALHKESLQLSIATVPNAPGTSGDGAFSKWIFANWRAAYDLKAIGEAVDLVCLMTYDEHTRYTPPGPVAGHLWTLENLEYALRVVPKEKLSLGIPLYGYHWFAGDPGKDEKPNPANVTVGAADVDSLLNTYHPEVQWDSVDRASWFWFYRDQTREWVFFTDLRTFRERWDLVKQRGLQGFCSWVLGKEDPAIWELLPAHP
jgi:spore germination protein YaaH